MEMYLNLKLDHQQQARQNNRLVDCIRLLCKHHYLHNQSHLMLGQVYTLYPTIHTNLHHNQLVDEYNNYFLSICCHSTNSQSKHLHSQFKYTQDNFHSSFLRQDYQLSIMYSYSLSIHLHEHTSAEHRQLMTLEFCMLYVRY